VAGEQLILEFLGKDKISGVTKGIASSLGGLAKGAAVVAAAGLVAVSGAAMGLGAVLVGMGSNAEEMMGKFNVVFGESADRVTSSLDEFGKSVGRSKYDLMGMAASIQDTFVPMGFARDEAASLSIQLTELATDVASFNNANDPDVMRDFQSALVGNHETVRKYGIVITEATLNQELLNMGIEGGTKAATEAQKVQARMNMIFAGTTDAQGDAARTSQSWANQMRRLKSIISDTATDMGLKLLPILSPILVKIGDLATKASPLIIAAFERFAAIMTERVVPAATQFVEGFLIPFAQRVGMLIATILPGLGAGFSSLGGFIQQAAQVIIGFAAQAIPAILLFVRETIIPLINQAIQIFGQFANFLLTNVVPAIVGFVQNTALPFLGRLADFLIGTVIPAIVNFVTNTVLPLFGQLVTFLTTTVIPAVLGFVENTLVPLFDKIIEFAEQAIPWLLTAFQNVATFITETAAPAITDFVQNRIIPMIDAIKAWIAELIERAKPIIEEFQAKLTGVLGPAMEVISDAGNRIAEAFRITGVQVGGAGGQVDVISGLLWVFKAVLDAVVIAVQVFAVGMKALADAVVWVRNAVQWVIDKFNKLKDLVENFELPYWLTPGSPTPFELGLRGIAKAAGEMNSKFGGSFTLGGSAGGGGGTPAYAGGGIGGGIVVNLTYSPVVSLADRYEAEQKLAPYIAAALRERGL
jgi:hypothetical protein